MFFGSLHQVTYLVCSDISEEHAAPLLTVIELGSGGCFFGSEEEICRLYRKGTKIVANQSYRKGSENKSCTEPMERDFLWT